jgi:hypothetical protein
MSVVSEIEFLQAQIKQFVERLEYLKLGETLDIASHPISNGQMVGFKNSATGKFISKGEKKTRSSNWSKSSDTIENNMFCVSNYKDNKDEHIISSDNLKAFDLSRTDKIPYQNTYQKPFIFYDKHEDYNKIFGDIGTNQRWNIIKTKNGIMIRSCYNKSKELVLIQKDDTYVCMPWNDIKDTELAKFAYWIIIIKKII